MEEYLKESLSEYLKDELNDEVDDDLDDESDLNGDMDSDMTPKIDDSVFPEPIEGVKGKKECKIIHINDGREETLFNGNFLFVEEWPATAQIIQKYLDAGYEVKKIIPDFTPAIQKEGSYSFYKTGMTVYFERNL